MGEIKSERITVRVTPSVSRRIGDHAGRKKASWIAEAIDQRLEREDTQAELDRIRYVYGQRLVEGAYMDTTDDRLGRWYWDDIYSEFIDRRGPGYASAKDAVEDWLQLERSGAIRPRYELATDLWGSEPMAFGSLGALQAALLDVDPDAPEIDDDDEHIYYFDPDLGEGERVYIGEVLPP